MTQKHYTFDEIATSFVIKAGRYTVRRYGYYGVTYADASQEVLEWLYGSGEPKVRRWLAASPQQTTRIYRSMLDRSLGYAERVKAARCGYEVDDVTWYTPSMVEALMPLVFDDTFTGKAPQDGDTTKSGKPENEKGDLLVLVIDIRRAIELAPEWVGNILRHDNADERYDDAIRTVVNVLGGERPYVGRRRPVSNAQALAMTGSEY